MSVQEVLTNVYSNLLYKMVQDFLDIQYQREAYKYFGILSVQRGRRGSPAAAPSPLVVPAPDISDNQLQP